jgi:transcriptional regulator with PAS, ATPase and Fis domain
MPIKVGREVESALVLTMSIEDLKTTIAHATGLQLSLQLVQHGGRDTEFLALQHKASRVARGEKNILLQGEPGTGKQRLAHGIHQASPRAAAPLIVLNAPTDRMKSGKKNSSVAWTEIINRQPAS